MILPTLYKKDKNGLIRCWTIKTDNGKITTEYGIFGGKPAISTYTAEAKNVGKINESTSISQAVTEAKAKFKLQKSYGYKDIFELGYKEGDITTFIMKNIPYNATDDNNVLKPMKAVKFYEVKDKEYPYIGQFKINGFRAKVRWETIIEGEGLFSKEVSKATMRTKEGHEYIVPHITNLFNKEMFFDGVGYDLTYDGEIYIPNTLLSEIKRHLPIKTDKGTTKPALNPEELEFWMFDMAIENMEQTQRLILLYNQRDKYIPITCQSLTVLSSEMIRNDEEAEAYRDKAILLGYEGCILRKPNALYGFGKRTSDMIKFKKWKHTECKILDVVLKKVEEKENSDRTHIVFILKNDLNDGTFESVPLGDEAQRLEYLNNKHMYIGKLATIRFYERTVNDLPYHSNVELVGREDIEDM